MSAVDDHSGELGKHAALSLQPQVSNPDPGTASGNGVFWVDTAGVLHFKTPTGVEATIQTSASAGAFLPVTVLTTSALAANTYVSATQKLTFTSTGTQTVNGVLLAVGMRVAAFGESSANNGIYDVLVAPAVGVKGVLVRSADANVSGDFLRGKAISISAQDTTNGGKFYEISNTGAITLDTTTITVAEVVISFADVNTALGAANASIGVNGQKITSLSSPSAPNDAANKSYVDAKFPQVKFWENDLAPNNALFAQTGSGAVNVSFQRVSFPYGISATQMDLLGALSVVASTNFSYTLSAAMYTFATGTNSTVISSVSSSQFPVTVNSTAFSVFGSTRYRSMPLGTWNITPGEYMLALAVSCNGPAGTTGSFSFFGQNSVSVSGIEGANANYTAYFGPGLYSAATAAFPASVPLGGINQTGAASQSNPLGQPYIRLIAAGA